MSSPKILLVDDDADDRLLFTDALKEIDRTLQCEEVINGIQALYSLRTGTTLPDLIFLDLNMPKMNGYECLRELKKAEGIREIPVVIYSTSNAKSEEQRMLISGAKHFLTKPADFTVLISELEKILRKELF
jgi:CheY-like chemotaxis protein